ncbi:MAG: hypothetical protein L0H73_13695 [Nitrococcus sp.]|nr:hypothetical protein [Nitrococcus sp.]
MKRRGLLWVLVAALVLVLAGCGQHEGKSAMREASGNGEDMESVVENLRTIAKARVLFGHQSVGRNILAGLESLSKEAGVPLRIVEISGAPPNGPGIFHTNIGQNGNPVSKVEMFQSFLTANGKPQYDIAMMKFCYVDLRQDTPLGVAEMIDQYSRMVNHIRLTRPEVQLVHITMPLVAEPPGKKTAVKRFFGLATVEDANNILRNAYNDALRAKYSGEAIFDLAGVESTLPDGTRSAFKHDGKAIYTLANAYTQDGGHLNEVAQRRAAIAFVQTLASTLEARKEPRERVAEL